MGGALSVSPRAAKAFLGILNSCKCYKVIAMATYRSLILAPESFLYSRLPSNSSPGTSNTGSLSGYEGLGPRSSKMGALAMTGSERHLPKLPAGSHCDSLPLPSRMVWGRTLNTFKQHSISKEVCLSYQDGRDIVSGACELSFRT